MVKKVGLKTTGVRKALLAASMLPMKSSAILPSTITIEKPIGGPKNGGKRILTKIAPPKQKVAKALADKPATKLRSSITPGTVLIVLAGRFRGKRVVFLKQLTSGLLLVTGPYKINGVPLTRISQAFVIATATKVELSGLTIPDALTDAVFKGKKCTKKASFVPKDKASSMDVEETKCAIAPVRREAQKSIDATLTASIKKQPMLASYLRSMFSLSKGEAPHAMCF
ncbi:60S ribosomal protein L6 [Mitosporidium daphniae]|uniref:60S ribosomal protein L6 n=1 Tax=Mitosporidium daphniae TaxID=1485682 RepID=A0A098VQP2_9MICR|nr:60S ribosomal protein L6 [Mitosporidium daphniae]KGG51144.1 60S ribosomal protein L6 [Mitosporidium daphniae]|eukprot:XP_013237571.1 60S ribosomal protein L6 [Mitosporidium daphniae]